MWLSFWLDHLHFAVSLLAVISLLTVSWLYVDSWNAGRSVSRLAMIIGFGAAGLSYLFEGPLLAEVAGRAGLSQIIGIIAGIRLIGFMSIAVGAWIEPIIERPKLRVAVLTGWPLLPAALTPIAAAMAALGVMRRGTLGLEAHVRALSIGLFLFAASELVRLYGTVTGSTLPAVVGAASVGGILWWFRVAFLAAAAVVTLRWAASYLFKQVFTQLFLAFQWTAVGCFFLVTVVFTAVLLKTVEAQTQSQLRVSAGVLASVISSRRETLTADLAGMAKDPAIASIAAEGHSVSATAKIRDLMGQRGMSVLRVIDAGGGTIAAGESDRGVGIPNQDTILTSIKSGKNTDDIVHSTVGGGILLTSGVPLVKDGKTVGSLIGAVAIDSAFLQNIQNSTGLDAWIVSENRIMAGGTNLRDGMLIADANTLMNSVNEGKPSVGEFLLGDLTYLGAAVPLVDSAGQTTAVIIAARPVAEQLKIGSDAIMMTFVLTILLSALMTVPVWILSSTIARQYTV